MRMIFMPRHQKIADQGGIGSRLTRHRNHDADPAILHRPAECFACIAIQKARAEFKIAKRLLDLPS